MPPLEPRRAWRRHVHAHPRLLHTALAVSGAGDRNRQQPQTPTRRDTVAATRVQTRRPTRGNSPLTRNRSSGMPIPLPTELDVIRSRSGDIDHCCGACWWNASKARADPTNRRAERQLRERSQKCQLVSPGPPCMNPHKPTQGPRRDPAGSLIRRGCDYRAILAVAHGSGRRGSRCAHLRDIGQSRPIRRESHPSHRRFEGGNYDTRWIFAGTTTPDHHFSVQAALEIGG